MNIEEKRNWLKNNGWVRFNYDDNQWLQRKIKYINIEWVILTTEQAFNYAKR